MNKKIESIRIANNILLIFVTTMVGLMCLQMPRTKGLYLFSISMVLFVVLSEVISALINNLVLFLLGHLLSGGILFILARAFADTATRNSDLGGISYLNVASFIQVFLMLIVTGISIKARLEEKERYYPDIVLAFYFFILLAFSKMTKRRDAEYVILFCEMLWALLCALYYNLAHIRGVLSTLSSKDFVPYSAIKSNNRKVMSFWLTLGVIGMIFSTFLDYGKEVLAILKSGLIAVLKFIFSFLSFEPETEYGTTEKEAISGYGELLPEVYEDNTIWHALWNILFWVVDAAVTILIIYVVIKLIREFYKVFNESRSGIKRRLSRDKVEYLNPFDEKESAHQEKASLLDRIGLTKYLSPKARVRALFASYIRRGAGFIDVKKSQTPSEMEKTSLRTTKEDSNLSAAHLYEKARYSTRQITSEDVKNMKTFTS